MAELKEVARYPSSSSSRVYVVKQDQENGNLSCDCPAWRFKKPNQERCCKHTLGFSAGYIPAAPTSATPVEVDPDQVMAELMAETERDPGKPAWRSLADGLKDLES